LIFFKKGNQTDFKKKNQNRFKPISFGFGFLGQKPVQIGWLGFFSLAWFFPVWVRFGSIFSVSGL
jgi:hypothetical protein